MSANAIETLGAAVDELAISHTDGDADVAEARAALDAVEALLEAAWEVVQTHYALVGVMDKQKLWDAIDALHEAAAAVRRVETGQ